MCEVPTKFSSCWQFQVWPFKIQFLFVFKKTHPKADQHIWAQKTRDANPYSSITLGWISISCLNIWWFLADPTFSNLAPKWWNHNTITCWYERFVWNLMTIHLIICIYLIIISTTHNTESKLIHDISWWSNIKTARIFFSSIGLTSSAQSPMHWCVGFKASLYSTSKTIGMCFLTSLR